MVDRPHCPKCQMELPEMLLAAHIEACDEEHPETVEQNDPPGGEMTGQEDTDLFPEVTPFDIDILGTMDEREGSGGVADPDVDEEFQRLVGSLDLSDIGPMIPDVVVTTLDDAELSSRYNETREKLMEMGEMINCSTQTGRDLHSQRAAYIIELRRRGLLQ